MTKGLEQLIQSSAYRQALGLPEEVTETYALLAQGEYNRNYIWKHPVTGKQLVLRVNYGSQMHLEHQIEYEYGALKLLAGSKRTPRPLYVDGSKRYLDHGVLVMEYLPGRVLDYKTDLKKAAMCLGDIHSVSLSDQQKSSLLKPENGLRAILEECEEMVKTYMESDLAPGYKKEKIRRMLDLGWKRLEETNLQSPYECCINTELNSTNFLMNDDGQDYLIDWEKPLLGDPAQDLGHFLAPTTTFWKTDIILTLEDVAQFMDDYCDCVGTRFSLDGIRERVMTYIPITCLRGITWCAMAWVEYQDPDKPIFNESTFRKLEDYLSDSYLDMIFKEYLKGA